MLPDRVSNPGPLTYESGALPIALRGPASSVIIDIKASPWLYCTHNLFHLPYPIQNSCLSV